MRHAISRPIAKAAIGPSQPAEGSDKEEPRFAELFVDEDVIYRWYQEELPTEAAAPTLRKAIDAALVRWPKLEITEIRGEAFVWFEHEQFEDAAAADELDASEEPPAPVNDHPASRPGGRY
jgi:hypothetical protein